ncbi:MAG: AI-2E family transporter [Candidatus Altimarinota bacterium]
MENFPNLLKTAILVIFIYLAYVLIQPFIGIIMVSVIFAISFFPLFKLFNKKISRGLSAFLTVFFSTTLIILPLISLIPLLIREAVLFSEHFDVNGTLQFVQSIKEINLFGYVIDLNFDPQAIIDASSTVGTYIAAKSVDILAMVSNSIGNFLIFIILYYYFLKDGKTLFQSIKTSLPYHKKEQAILIDSFKKTAEVVFIGNFLTAAISGVMAFLGASIFGLPSPIIWALLATILSFIPTAGALLLYLFGTLILFFSTGWLAALGLAIYFIIMEIILRENFIKPKLLDDKLSLHPVFIFFALIGGVTAFGSLGLFYGPIILTFLASLYQFHTKTDHLKP